MTRYRILSPTCILAVLACEPADAPIPKTVLSLAASPPSSVPTAASSSASVPAPPASTQAPVAFAPTSECEGTELDLDDLAARDKCTTSEAPTADAPSGPGRFEVSLGVDSVAVLRQGSALIPVIYTNRTDSAQALIVGACTGEGGGIGRGQGASRGTLLSEHAQINVHSSRAKHVDTLPSTKFVACLGMCNYRGVRVKLGPRGKATLHVAYSPWMYKPEECTRRHVGSLPKGTYALELELPKGEGRYDATEKRGLKLIVQ